MYYFIGIQGTGMSALAIILKQLGYNVKGSDVDKTFFTKKELINNNIEVLVYNENNITKDLTIIKGASITEDNVELKKARSINAEIIEYEEMLGRITKQFKTICIAGCHGKTTTTAMTSLILDNTIGTNYLIGDGSGHGSKDNEFFTLESCEYRRHFLSYLPYYAVVLNIDLDHVDYFKDINDIIDAYQEFSNSATKMVIACGDDENTKKMKLTKPVIYFGINEDNDVRATNIKYTKDGTSFDVLINNKQYEHFDLPIFALHQVLDALAAITISYLENIDSKDIARILKTFKGAKRRFTETIVKDSIIIDDYAHHPNEVKATINAAKQKYPDKQIITIFQPHTFTRTEEFAKDLIEVFKEVNAAYIMDIHPAREKQEDYPEITKDIILKDLPNGHPLKIDEAKELAKYNNAVFLFMSPNDISKLEDDLKKLK